MIKGALKVAVAEAIPATSLRFSSACFCVVSIYVREKGKSDLKYLVQLPPPFKRVM